MSLILITGTSTSGKSTIAKELSKRGYEAYDTEYNGISAWYNNKTGKRVAGFNEMPERTEAWLNQHEWNISIDWVKKMSQKAKDKPIFLCGGSHNNKEVQDLCDIILWLATNEATIRRRVHNPRDHDYGTKPHELALTLKWNKINEAEHRDQGSVIIDATQPIDIVVDEIIDKVAQLSRYETN
jgi:broad-specificity NMP kinase